MQYISNDKVINVIMRSETKCLQGIAILFMLGLHLFNRIDISNFYDVKIYLGGVPLLTRVSYIFDACVPIYLFCSGYGLYISEDIGNNMKKRAHRVLKLLIRFWIVMIFTCCVGFILGMRDRFLGSLLNFILNACLVKKYSYWVVLPISLVLYVGAFGVEYVVLGKMEVEAARLFVNALMLFMRSQFSFVIGMVLAKENMLDCSKLLSKIRNNPILPWIFLFIVIVGRAVLRHMIFTPTLVFCSRNVFVIMLTLVMLSLAASYVVDWVYNLVTRGKMYIPFK